MSEPRLRRPEPERTAPIRGAASSFAASFGASPRSPTAAPDATEAPQVPHVPHVPQVIDRAVQTAYRVIDDYIQQGFRTAARFEHPMGGTPMSHTPPTGQVQEMANLALRFWSEMAQAWMGPMSQNAPWRAWGGGGPDAAWDRGEDPSPRAQRGASPSTSAAPSPSATPSAPVALAVSIDLAAQQPAEVTVQLQPGTRLGELVAQDLRAVDGDGKPPLAAVRVEEIEARLRVQITIPRDQPAGIYSGTLFDRARGEVRGSLTVAVRARE